MIGLDKTTCVHGHGPSWCNAGAGRTGAGEHGQTQHAADAVLQPPPTCMSTAARTTTQRRCSRRCAHKAWLLLKGEHVAFLKVHRCCGCCTELCILPPACRTTQRCLHGQCELKGDSIDNSHIYIAAVAGSGRRRIERGVGSEPNTGRCSGAAALCSPRPRPPARRRAGTKQSNGDFHPKGHVDNLHGVHTVGKAGAQRAVDVNTHGQQLAPPAPNTDDKAHTDRAHQKPLQPRARSENT